ncbi:MAG: aminotransferase class V-fold PLP-dependent enzyme [Candidatus Aminicenantes bacterium]|nr:aminotransferase class V-fold PLP-dependent enzyme [Candidatus Aminicenantes bacterium]
MVKNHYNLEKDIDQIRDNFPILSKGVYLISNSLGAVPAGTRNRLLEFINRWETEGVAAWRSEWWDLSRKTGNQIGSFLGTGDDEITMMTNATLCHWVALSTKFERSNKKKNRIIMTTMDFPSIVNAVSKIAEFMEWTVDIVDGEGGVGIDADKIIERIREDTLFVATSHVYFKSAYIQDIQKIAASAHEKGAYTLIDGYHAPGIIPIDLHALGVDFYVGGCLKWLCGGPGTAFLYVRPEISSQLQPKLTGWLAHSSPFSFSLEMNYTQNSYRYLSGTPPIPCLYTALAGLEEINKVGITQIRSKSIIMTDKIIKMAKERGFTSFSPETNELRGGSVSLQIPFAFQVKQGLDERKIQVDFRKGNKKEPDVIRVGPHFYNTEAEINEFFYAVDAIISTGEYRNYSTNISQVT